MRVGITGAGGFIGAYFCQEVLRQTDWRVRAFIRETNPLRLRVRLLDHPHVKEAIADGRLEIIRKDITASDLSEYFHGNLDVVLNFAAKTHVDFAQDDPWPYVESNVIGVFNVLEACRRGGVKRLIQVSTDEVLGSTPEGVAYDETAKIACRNPYAASKAAAEALVLGHTNSYKMNTAITRAENVYGPTQCYKVMPVWTKQAVNNEPLGVYDDGMNVRMWVHVEDMANAFIKLVQTDTPPGEIYHIAGNNPVTNLDLAKKVLKIFGKPDDMIKFMPQARPGHDPRYQLDSSKFRKTTGWEPKISLDQGLPNVLQWYKDHPWWN